MEDMLHEDPWTNYVKEAEDYYKQQEVEKYWYLATPYSRYKKGLEQAYIDACKMTALLLENNIFTFSPIVNSHGVCQYLSDPKNVMSHDFWLDVDFKYIRNSRGLIVCMMDGWDKSYGIQKEIEFAHFYNLPVHYVNFMELPRL